MSFGPWLPNPDALSNPPIHESFDMRLPRIAVALLLVAALAMASLALAAIPLRPETTQIQVIFPAGTVVHVSNFSALARFTVVPPGAQFVGAFHADHSMWIMAWTNGTPMPLCPIAQGYVGPPMNASYNETLKPETYTFSEVCGGLGNFTVTEAIELVYPNAANGTGSGGSAGGIGGTGSGAGGIVASPVAMAAVLAVVLAAALLVAGVVVWVRRRSLRRPPMPPAVGP